MSLAFITEFTERQNRTLKRIVEMLNAAEARTESMYKRARKHDRKEFQGRIYIFVPTAVSAEPSEDCPTTLPAWAYNLSQGGVGFVAPNEIAQKSVAIGLKRPDGAIRWMTGRIVRSRPIPNEDFFDYGVAFQRQPDPANSESAGGRVK